MITVKLNKENAIGQLVSPSQQDWCEIYHVGNSTFTCVWQMLAWEALEDINSALSVPTEPRPSAPLLGGLRSKCTGKTQPYFVQRR